MARLNLLLSVLSTAVLAAPAGPTGPVTPVSTVALNLPGMPHMQCHHIYCDHLSAVNPQCAAHACGGCTTRNYCADIDELVAFGSGVIDRQ